MNGKKAKMCRHLARMLQSQYPGQTERYVYKEVKKAYMKKTGPFRNG